MTAPESCGSNSNEDRHTELIRLEASRVNLSYLVTFEPHHEKTCFMPYANNKDADQPVVECRTPEREVGGSIPTAAVLCP